MLQDSMWWPGRIRLAECNTSANIFEILIAPLIFFNVGSKVRVDHTDTRVVEVKTDCNSAFVALQMKRKVLRPKSSINTTEKNTVEICGIYLYIICVRIINENANYCRKEGNKLWLIWCHLHKLLICMGKTFFFLSQWNKPGIQAAHFLPIKYTFVGLCRLTVWLYVVIFRNE